MLKEAAIACGVYRPARYLFDRALRRDVISESRSLGLLISKFVKPGDLCFDIGANVGRYTVMLRSLGARVVAVEPHPRCGAELEVRFYRDPGVKLERVAVGGQKGIADFFIRKETSHSGMVAAWSSENLESIKVPVTTLDDLIVKHGKPSFVKVDVEGYEAEVIRGLSTPVRTISLEYHLSEADVNSKKEILQYLTTLSDIELNIITHERGSFYWPEFVSVSDFYSVFPYALGEISSTAVPEHNVGDIYIRGRAT